jgi:hypothetical protein
MSDDMIPRWFNDSQINQRVTDGYINLNQIADAAGKRIQDWLDNKGTQELIGQFEAEQNLHHADQRDVEPALITSRARVDRGGGTWAHPDIAIQFAQWCNPAFALQVSRWVREWMTTGRSPLADLDRVDLRGTLKDDSRLRMTDQVKVYLETIRGYDNKKHRGIFFAQVHDAINCGIAGETAKQMKVRLSNVLGRKVKEDELIRDYFPSSYLNRYINVCEVVANLMISEEYHPLTAVEEALRLTLPAGYQPIPINFVEHIKFVHQRLQPGQTRFELPGE